MSADATAILTQAMTRTMDTHRLALLEKGLTVVSPRHAKQAARGSATALTQAIINPKTVAVNR